MASIWTYRAPQAWDDAFERDAYLVTYDCAKPTHAYDVSKSPSHCVLLVL